MVQEEVRWKQIICVVDQFASYSDGKHPKQCRVFMEGIEKEVGPEVEIEQITKDETRARTQREKTDPDPDCR